jgi:hypothetical protein
VPNGVFEAFPSDTSPEKLALAFRDIKAHESFQGLKLRVAVFSVKHSSRKPFMEETFEVSWGWSCTRVGGAACVSGEGRCWEYMCADSDMDRN